MYKGYRIYEQVHHYYEIGKDSTIVLDCAAGCAMCEEEHLIQTGHYMCGLLPVDTWA